MNTYLWLFIAIIIISVVIAILFPTQRRKGVAKEPSQAKVYNYVRRDYLMTPVEMKLFRRLEQIATDRYYVFPQVHLSSLLDHTAAKQDWRAALSAIQRKSVDFVLVDKTNLQTVYAVELDDSSHDAPDRQERDGKVEQYLLDANIPLVRLRGIDNMSDEDIENAFRRAHDPR